jgi:membrane-bound metal-dependent hydrolase YbcI (DUF457 family)
MTGIGHGLTGASIAVLTMPSGWSARTKCLLVGSFAVLANLPDLRLPSWGHERYDISHSVFVNAGLIVVACLILLSFRRVRERPATGRVLLGGGLAWLSHLLLDSFYGHGKGIAIFWPFSRARLNLPVPWFETVRVPLPHVDAHTVRVWAIELAVYGTILALAVTGRRLYAKHSARAGN